MEIQNTQNFKTSLDQFSFSSEMFYYTKKYRDESVQTLWYYNGIVFVFLAVHWNVSEVPTQNFEFLEDPSSSTSKWQIQRFELTQLAMLSNAVLVRWIYTIDIIINNIKEQQNHH